MIKLNQIKYRAKDTACHAGWVFTPCDHSQVYVHYTFCYLISFLTPGEEAMKDLELVVADGFMPLIEEIK